MAIKETIEDHPIVWFLSTLIVAFIAGLNAYHWGLDFVGRHVVPEDAVVLQKNEVAIAVPEYNDLVRFKSEVEPIKARETFYRIFLRYIMFKDDRSLGEGARAKNKDELVKWVSRNYQATVSGNLSDQEARVAIIKKGSDWLSGTATLKGDKIEWPIPMEIKEAVHELNP